MSEARTSQDQWSAVDRYFGDLLIGRDEALDAALDASTKAGLPAINVSPSQGKLLHILARMCGARRILEIGTLGGYSTIWMARALPPAPDGQLVTLEYEPKHAEIARANIARAKVDDRVEVIVGPALETLPRLESQFRDRPFDLLFIDADKVSTPDYFRWSLRLSRPGGVIVVDNVVRKGAVADPNSTDASVQGIRRFNDLLAAEQRAGRVTATAVQTVGGKGYDGFAIALVTARA